MKTSEQIEYARSTGVALRKMRLALSLTPAQVAELVCVHPNTLANWELGRTIPRADQLIRIVSELKLASAKRGAPQRDRASEGLR